MMKRFLALFLAFVLLFGLMSVDILATDTEAFCTDGHSYNEMMAVDNDTRQGMCSLCGKINIFDRMEIPTYYSGNIYVENNLTSVYYGTRNVADLLGLKSGTYTNGEVTISITGTNISVSGTPSKNIYFDMQTGEFGTPDYLRDPGYTLPDGDYRFGITGSGSAYPTVCIRTSDGKSNQIAVAGIKNAPGLSGESFGIPYLYLPKNKTYDFSGRLILNMGIDKTYDGDIAGTTKIEGSGVFSVNGYLWASNTDTSVFAERASRDIGKLTYSGGSKEYINIYLPQEVGYLQIQMNLENSASKNSFGWRLNMIYACDNQLKQIFPITSSGEYEAAIRLVDRPDFMGMGAHGSERMTSFVMYIDGEKVDLTKLDAITDWNTIKIVRESDFYDPLDEATIVATHTVDYEFDLTGLTVIQDVEWLVDATCITSYMMMFPVRRVYENLQITDTYFDDYNPAQYDVSEPGFTTYPLKWTKGAAKMTLYSEKSGITASMESLETPVLTGTGYKHCANSENYNKLYFTICGGGNSTYQAVAGEQWHTKHRYYVTIGQGTDVADPCAFGHSYVPAVTPPTCTKQGYTTYTCHCGDSYVAGYVDTLGHSYENGRCTVCGTAAPSPYAGKTIACIGDSITYGVGVTQGETDYVTLLANALEMDYIRLGVSGTTLCTDGSRTCNIGKLTESNLQGADVVTIAMGINDFCAAGSGYYELGDINTTDSSTIYGAVRMWCERIVELRKNDSLKDTEFYFVTPLITSWNNSVNSVRNWDQSKVNIHGYTLRDLCNAIIEVARLYDVAVVDMNLISGLYYVNEQDNNIAVFGGDGVHPGVEGHAMMAAALEDVLVKNHLRDDHAHVYKSWITTTYPCCADGEEKRVCELCHKTESRKLDGIGHTYQSGVCMDCGKAVLLGDLTGDGNVNVADVARLYSNIKKDLMLEDLDTDYCYDISGDGRLTILDVSCIYAHIRGTRPLWEIPI